MNRTSLCATVLAVAVAAAWSGPASASTYDVLHNFCAQPSCKDGTHPGDTVASDAAGTLHGVVGGGGARGRGVAVQFVPIAGKARYKTNLLYHFCAQNGCLDGSGPVGMPVVDTAGNVYGVTNQGGANDGGTVWRLSLNPDGRTWTRVTLYDFCSRDSACEDGGGPTSGLTYQGQQSGALYDGTSPLYGATNSGGVNLAGVVYSLTPKPHGAWKQKTLYAFCATGGQSCTDGSAPLARPTFDGAGNLYGTTLAGGAHKGGTVYKLSPQTGLWNETVLYSFCALANCVDGRLLQSEVVLDAAGNVFGTTQQGGPANSNCANFGCGVLFEITSGGAESTLYAFCALANCTDGETPTNHGGLALDASGNLYGTTQFGGDNRGGALFRYGSGGYERLYSFCVGRAHCASGAAPQSGVSLGPSGSLLGTTASGGFHNGGGTLYRFTP